MPDAGVVLRWWPIRLRWIKDREHRCRWAFHRFRFRRLRRATLDFEGVVVLSPSGELSKFCSRSKIRLDVGSVAHPQSNGQVERTNGIILQGI